MGLLKFFKSLFRRVPSRSPLDCFQQVRSGEVVLIDVREPRECASGMADRAVALPLSDLTGSRAQWKPFLAAHDGREMLVYCAAGGRSGIAARILLSEGFRAVNTGSLSSWARAGWPLVKPSSKRR